MPKPVTKPRKGTLSKREVLAELRKRISQHDDTLEDNPTRKLAKMEELAWCIRLVRRLALGKEK